VNAIVAKSATNTTTNTFILEVSNILVSTQVSRRLSIQIWASAEQAKGTTASQLETPKLPARPV
jgi:hypothetical protein